MQECTLQRGWVQGKDIIPAAIFSLMIQDWMRNADHLVEVGEWFHAALEQEFARAGLLTLPHDDDGHDRYVGVAVEMIRSGQPHKGAIFYNRWAQMSGFDKIRIVGVDPICVDIGNDAILEVHGRNFFLASPGSAMTVPLDPFAGQPDPFAATVSGDEQLSQGAL